jgi:glycosyltransferase involved in cell wall biosynthesis
LGDKLVKAYAINSPLVLYNVSPLLSAAELVSPAKRLRRAGIRLHWFGQTIGRGRGLEEAVEALGLLAAEPVELHLRGSVTADFRSLLERLARRSGVRDKISFDLPVFSDDLVNTLDQYDVGLALERPDQPNYSLAATNKLLSYFLAGLAVAATDTPGHREILEQTSAAGFLYAAGDPRALAEGLRQWLSNHESLVAAQEAAWKTARERFCWDIEKEKFLAVAGNANSRRVQAVIN